jgi:ectoine hydroxylase
MAGRASDSALVPVAERERFEQDGYLIIRGALTHDEVLHYREALDRAYLSAGAESLVAPGGSLHWLSAVARCPQVVGLVDHPATFPYVWSLLGWNIHVYHSHLDVHPPLAAPRPFRFEWHQDGGRQNREVETDPRPRMSVKLAYWLSDVSETGRGNYSTFTRKAVFFGYTYRWIAIRDENDGIWATGWASQLSPVQRQLLGGLQPGDGDHAWGHSPATTPLYGWLRERDLLDPAYPPLRP